jgi:hypothetical protein
LSTIPVNDLVLAVSVPLVLLLAVSGALLFWLVYRVEQQEHRLASRLRQQHEATLAAIRDLRPAPPASRPGHRGALGRSSRRVK